MTKGFLACVSLHIYTPSETGSLLKIEFLGILFNLKKKKKKAKSELLQGFLTYFKNKPVGRLTLINCL